MRGRDPIGISHASTPTHHSGGVRGACCTIQDQFTHVTATGGVGKSSAITQNAANDSEFITTTGNHIATYLY